MMFLAPQRLDNLQRTLQDYMRRRKQRRLAVTVEVNTPHGCGPQIVGKPRATGTNTKSTCSSLKSMRNTPARKRINALKTDELSVPCSDL